MIKNYNIKLFQINTICITIMYIKVKVIILLNISMNIFNFEETKLLLMII